MNFRYGDIFYGDKEVKVLTYDELVLQAIRSGENSFEYHNHAYEVKKREDEFYDIFSNDEKVAEAIYEDDSCAVIIDDDKKEYVRNTRSRYYENLYKKDLEKVRSRPYPEPPKDERW